MKKFALISTAVLALAACNSASTTMTTANNTLATLANNQIPAACAIVKVAEGYYSAIVGAMPIPAVTTAESVVGVICANPPTDLAGAFTTLLNEWTVIQAATVKPN